LLRAQLGLGHNGRNGAQSLRNTLLRLLVAWLSPRHLPLDPIHLHRPVNADAAQDVPIMAMLDDRRPRAVGAALGVCPRPTKNIAITGS
jgi:hypothetical protein